jgi:hypothetical protein
MSQVSADAQVSAANTLRQQVATQAPEPLNPVAHQHLRLRPNKVMVEGHIACKLPCLLTASTPEKNLDSWIGALLGDDDVRDTLNRHTLAIR